MVGNREMIAALAKIKSYFDYGTFTPIQVASVVALESGPSVVQKICETYQHRRDTLVNGLNSIGWENEVPKGTICGQKFPKLLKSSLHFAERY